MRVFKEPEIRNTKIDTPDEAKKPKRKRSAEAKTPKPVKSIEDNPEIVKLEKPKKEFSDREIREKLSAHLNKSNSATTMNKIKKEELLGSGFLNEDVVNQKIETQKVKSNEVIAKASELSGNANSAEGTKTTISVEKIEKPSDVGTNNPQDPLTANKLKSVLDMGAFNFNPKERDVLSKILNERV